LPNPPCAEEISRGVFGMCAHLPGSAIAGRALWGQSPVFAPAIR